MLHKRLRVLEQYKRPNLSHSQVAKHPGVLRVEHHLNLSSANRYPYLCRGWVQWWPERTATPALSSRVETSVACKPCAAVQSFGSRTMAEQREHQATRETQAQVQGRMAGAGCARTRRRSKAHEEVQGGESERVGLEQRKRPEAVVCDSVQL